MEYPILDKEKHVGRACVIQQGMTMLIRCRCMGSEAKNRMIYLGNMALGRCLPEAGEYSVVRRIPKRNFPEDPCFVLERTEPGKRILVREDRPVEGLELLRNARFSIEDGKPILIVEDQISSSSTTGQ